MNTFKKKSLHAAVLAGLGALGAAGTANAVHINPDGLGQVLIYPYYTVRNGNFTALSIVNTTSLTKAVKVRFLEGKNSREVLDFNLFLSPQDIWTGVIVATTDGAKLETGDNSCVTPFDLFGDATGAIRNDPLNLPINAFKNYQYTGTNVDNATLNSLDRTREGYMEVIEMGIVTDATLQGFIKHSQVAGATKGVPANCQALDAYDSASSAAAPATGKFPANLVAPGGGLTGRASIFNTAGGNNYTTDVTALDGWWNPIPAGPVPYSNSGNTLPSIATTAGIDTNSLVFITGTPAVVGPPAVAAVPAGVVSAGWLTPREAVTSIFMRDTIINEFVTDAATVSKTDWVITMPTKRDNLPISGAAPFRPFTNPFASATATGACDAYSLGIYNREEGTTSSAPGTILPSPRPPVAIVQGANLCWEANVVEFGSAGLLASTNNFRLLPPADAFASSGATSTGAAFATVGRRVLQGPNGWAFLGFGLTSNPAQAAQSMTPQTSSLNGVADAVPRTFFGLPVIGAMFHNYTNTGVASSYGSVIPHKYTRNIR